MRLVSGPLRNDIIISCIWSVFLQLYCPHKSSTHTQTHTHNYLKCGCRIQKDNFAMIAIKLILFSKNAQYKNFDLYSSVNYR